MSVTTLNPTGSPQGGPSRALADLRQIGKSVAREAGGTNVQAFFEAKKDVLKAMLPAHMKPERMLRVALGALRTTPKLMQCTVESLFGAIVTCSQLGLEPNTPQGHVYLIPFENKKKGTTEVQIVVGYKGLIDLARRSGEIVSISARTVHACDELVLDYGTEDRIVHRPLMTGDRGPMIGVYAVAKLRGGGVQFEFMTRAEIDAIRDRSQGYRTAMRFGKSDTPWITHYEEMAKKTAIRRLVKYLPSSIELASAARLDEKADAGAPQDMARVLDGSEYTDLAAEEPEDEPADTAATQPGDAP